MLALSYLFGMILGSVLLILPFATKDGQNTTYINSLFTAASAVSLTGLAPYDTATHWSLFGQLVILFLIQMSGLGFMTLVSTAFLVFRHTMSLSTRNVFMLDSSGGNLSGIKTLLKRIVLGTLIFETAGALLLMIRFIPDYGAGNGIYFSVWHSVSAFCNAGFDVLGTTANKFVSLSGYVNDPLVNLTICALIVLGGLGFAVWSDILDCKLNFKKFQLNTKVVLIVNATLIVSSCALFILFEWNNAEYASFSFGEKLLASLFCSITPRTAGFSTVSSTSLSDSGFLLTTVLMFIGGSSGSTAGGMRVGTFAVIITGMFASFRGKRDINIGKRRIDHSLLSRSLAILAAMLMILIVSVGAICAIQPETGIFKEVTFECVSALSNTGLSMDFTPKLKTASSFIIIILMYAGRVGILTLGLALGQTKATAEIRRPVDNLLIG